MKIIKKANPWWAGRQATCNVCETVVEMEADDADQSGNWQGNLLDGVSVSCPTCANTIAVPKVPPAPTKNGF